MLVEPIGVFGKVANLPDDQLASPMVVALSNRSRNLLVQLLASAMVARRDYVPRSWVRLGLKSEQELVGAGFIRIWGHPVQRHRQVVLILGMNKKGTKWRAPWPNHRREWQRVSKKLSPVVFARDGWCVRCMSMKRLTVDHIVPIARGGTNDLSNLQTLCQPCNSRKGVKLWPVRVS